MEQPQEQITDGDVNHRMLKQLYCLPHLSHFPAMAQPPSSGQQLQQQQQQQQQHLQQLSSQNIFAKHTDEGYDSPSLDMTARLIEAPDAAAALNLLASHDASSLSSVFSHPSLVNANVLQTLDTLNNDREPFMMEQDYSSSAAAHSLDAVWQPDAFYSKMMQSPAASASASGVLAFSFPEGIYTSQWANPVQLQQTEQQQRSEMEISGHNDMTMSLHLSAWPPSLTDNAQCGETDDDDMEENHHRLLSGIHRAHLEQVAELEDSASDDDSIQGVFSFSTPSNHNTTNRGGGGGGSNSSSSIRRSVSSPVRSSQQRQTSTGLSLACTRRGSLPTPSALPTATKSGRRASIVSVNLSPNTTAPSGSSSQSSASAARRRSTVNSNQAEEATSPEERPSNGSRRGRRIMRTPTPSTQNFSLMVEQFDISVLVLRHQGNDGRHPSDRNMFYYQARIRNGYPQRHLWSGWDTREGVTVRIQHYVAEFGTRLLEEYLPNLIKTSSYVRRTTTSA